MALTDLLCQEIKADNTVVSISVFATGGALTILKDATPDENPAVQDTDITISHPIGIPSTGIQYSMERWVNFKFSGAFTSITNVTVAADQTSLNASPPGDRIDIPTGFKVWGRVEDVAGTPTTPASDDPKTGWVLIIDSTTASNSIDISPASAITPDGVTKWLVLVAEVPAGVSSGRLMDWNWLINWDQVD